MDNVFKGTKGIFFGLLLENSGNLYYYQDLSANSFPEPFLWLEGNGSGNEVGPQRQPFREELIMNTGNSWRHCPQLTSDRFLAEK